MMSTIIKSIIHRFDSKKKKRKTLSQNETGGTTSCQPLVTSLVSSDVTGEGSEFVRTKWEGSLTLMSLCGGTDRLEKKLKIISTLELYNGLTRVLRLKSVRRMESEGLTTLIFALGGSDRV